MKDGKDGKDGKDVGDCLDGKFGGVGMEIRLVALPIEVEVTRIEGKAHSQRDKHLYKSASDHDGHSGDEGDELEDGELVGLGWVGLGFVVDEQLMSLASSSR